MEVLSVHGVGGLHWRLHTVLDQLSMGDRRGKRRTAQNGGDSMSKYDIPLRAIQKGRDLSAVLKEYQRIYDGAKKAAIAPGKSEDEVFADTLMGAAYRIYLLGVEDGMKP